MKDLLEKNKIPITIIVAAFIIAASIWLSNRPSAISLPGNPEREPPPQQSQESAQPLQPASTRISYTEAPNYIGKYACVTGTVNYVYTSRKGTTFINFCSDYKTCPFGVVIFASNASKFSNPEQYTGKNVEITGFITAYQGRPEIVLKSPAQIRIAQ
jgi:DNA/RNA endonuclease YhcR with UshA esterase domain